MLKMYATVINKETTEHTFYNNIQSFCVQHLGWRFDPTCEEITRITTEDGEMLEFSSREYCVSRNWE